MSEQPQGELRIRSKDEGVQVTGVNFPKRLIELIVAPYDEKTIVHQPYGYPVVESYCRGAFDGIQRRPNRIKVNRDHKFERTIGKAVALYPSREEGLVAELKIARTDLGDETLALAEEEILDASAGFLPMPDGEEWNRARTEVKIRKAWLGHIALVPEGAYEGARVLAVRNAAKPEERTATPNLDLIRSWRLTEEFERLSSR